MNKKKNNNKIANNTRSNLILAWLLIPLFAVSLMVSRKFIDTLVSPKEFYLFFYLGTFLVIFMLYLVFRKKNISLQFNLTDIFLVLFYLYCIIRIMIDDAGILSWTYFLLLSSIITLYGIVRYISGGENQKNVIRIILFGLLIFSFIQVIYGYLQLWDFASPAMPDFKVGGSFGNPGPFSNYIVSVLPLALGVHLFWKKESNFDKLITNLGFWLAVFTLLLLPATKARTSWVAAMAGVSIIIWNYAPVKDKIRKFTSRFAVKIGLVISLALIVIIGAYYLFNYKQDSASGRLFTWKLTKEIFMDYPLLGSGFNSFQVMHNDYQADFFSKKGAMVAEARLADNISFAFNEFFQVGSELGIIGLILFLGVFVSVFVRESKTTPDKDTKDITVFSQAALVAIVVCALFSYPFHDVPAFINAFVILGLASSGISPVFNKKLKPIIIKAIGATVIVLCLFFLNIQVKRYGAHKQWKAASLGIRENPTAMRIYEKLYPVLKYNGYFLYNYGAELSLANDHEKAIAILDEAMPKLNDSDVYTYLGNTYEGLGDLRKAEECFMQAWSLVPHKLYPQYRLVYIYAKAGRMEKALTMAKQIVEADVKVHSQVTNDIKVEMSKFINETLMEQAAQIE